MITLGVSFKAAISRSASRKLNQPSNDIRSSDPAWASRFTLLEADSMLYRGMYEDALASPQCVQRFRNSRRGRR